MYDKVSIDTISIDLSIHCPLYPAMTGRKNFFSNYVSLNFYWAFKVLKQANINSYQFTFLLGRLMITLATLQCSLSAHQFTLLALWPIRICLHFSGWMRCSVRSPLVAGVVLWVLEARIVLHFPYSTSKFQNGSIFTWWNGCTTRHLMPSRATIGWWTEAIGVWHVSTGDGLMSKLAATQ